jgi:hypothetical protein
MEHACAKKLRTIFVFTLFVVHIESDGHYDVHTKTH